MCNKEVHLLVIRI